MSAATASTSTTPVTTRTTLPPTRTTRPSRARPCLPAHRRPPARPPLPPRAAPTRTIIDSSTLPGSPIPMKTVATLLIALAALLCALPAHAQQSRLKPSDPVNIELKVPAEDAPNVTSLYTVSERGTVRVPYLNHEIQAAGLSITELARRIEAAYRAAEIYTNPTINVAINDPINQASHIVIVGGEVKGGGAQIPLRDNMRLYAAIMSAGGFTEFADIKRVKIIRGTKATVYDMRKLDPSGSNN